MKKLYQPYCFIEMYMYYVSEVKSLSRVQLFVTPVDHSPPGSSVHGITPGKKTGVGWHALLQRIFPTQGLNPYLLH